MNEYTSFKRHVYELLRMRDHEKRVVVICKMFPTLKYEKIEKLKIKWIFLEFLDYSPCLWSAKVKPTHFVQVKRVFLPRKFRLAQEKIAEPMRNVLMILSLYIGTGWIQNRNGVNSKSWTVLCEVFYELVLTR